MMDLPYRYTNKCRYQFSNYFIFKLPVLLKLRFSDCIKFNTSLIAKQ